VRATGASRGGLPRTAVGAPAPWSDVVEEDDDDTDFSTQIEAAKR